MKVSIISQNLFVATALARLLTESNLTNGSYIFVFSNFERTILRRFVDKRIKIFVVKTVSYRNEAAANRLPSSIEAKRKSYSLNTIKKLQSGLISMIEAKSCLADYGDIWIYNEHTFIAHVLYSYPEIRKKVFVLENANLRQGIAVVRSKFQDTEEKIIQFNNNSNINSELTKKERYLFRLIRLCSQLIQIRDLTGLFFQLKRVFKRVFNVMAFETIKLFENDKKIIYKDCILVIMQISLDSEILMRIQQGVTYPELLLHSIALEAEKHNTQTVVLRPHPKDYTLTWLKVCLALKSMQYDVFLNVVDYKKTNYGKLRSIITFSSNTLRDSYWVKTYECEAIFIGSKPKLPKFDQKLDTFLDGLF